MVKISSISEFESCELWINGFRSDRTMKSYALHLLLFCEFYNTIPDEIIKLTPGELKDMVIKYIIELKKKSKKSAGKPKRGEISVNSIKLYLAGIRSFLEDHEISLPWGKIVKYCPEDVNNNYRSYTRHEISKLLSAADLRDRCIILLMSSSGIRVGAIPSLTMKSLKRIDENLGLLTVYEDNKKSKYATLVTPECMSALDEYFEEKKTG